MNNTSTASLKIGDTYNGFTVRKSLPIPELQCHLTEFVHDQSGALCMHIASDDPENFFCLSFRTLPQSSDGVCHVLEHTVLCGSKKFPVRDPFFSMNRRSLNTFMNALTGADFTCYPAATQVEKDFYNLLEVYLDAVFNPLLNKLSFWQEGCRLEFETPNDPASPLQYKGIVFNEMKGALSSPMTRLIEAVNAALFPDTPYGFNSGGDPQDIPNLTYEELVEFHRTNYHPSRCLFFFSGNMPIYKHLDFLQGQILHGVSKLPPPSPIPAQPRFHKPIYKELQYPFSKEGSTEDKSLIAFAWLTCPILDQITLLALSVIDIVLMETDASLLKIELLRSGLCRQAQSMLESEVSEIPYAIIINGCKGSDAVAIETIIFDTLKRLSKEGIPLHLIETALHQLELAKSEITGDSAPFGLSLFSRAALICQHGGNAEDGLRIHSLFEELRQRFSQSPHFLSELINRYFITNTHYVRICMDPSQELGPEERKLEEEKLETIKQALSEKAMKEVVQRSEALTQFQNRDEDDIINMLPKISLSDVPKKARTLALSHLNAGSLDLFCHHAFTNEITYADLIFPVPDTKEEDLWLLRLFALVLTQMGSANRSYEENLAYIQENTGGISSYLHLYP
ncbi:MAG: insulinase family protein, partial [Verrucomicrobia bacterium]|nr:insulinase family protein [Verrucomicrobiota bacterium]